MKYSSKDIEKLVKQMYVKLGIEYGNPEGATEEQMQEIILLHAVITMASDMNPRRVPIVLDVLAEFFRETVKIAEALVDKHTHSAKVN